MHKFVLNCQFLIKLCLCASFLLVTYPISAKPTPNANSLYQRMGGEVVVTQIVEDFVGRITTDARTKRSFDGLNLKSLKESIVAQLCHLSGGGCVYEGETMVNSHRDANITEAEFDAFVGIFRETLNQYIPTAEKNALLKILAPMKRDIVMPVGGHPPNPNLIPVDTLPENENVQ